jgi:hypothetical protein
MCWADSDPYTALYRHDKYYHYHSLNDNGTLLGTNGVEGSGVNERSLGYGRIVGDDGLYNLSGMYVWNEDQYVILPWNRDRYHRVDTPGIVTDTVFTPRYLRDGDGIIDPANGLYLKDDYSNHKDYQVISRDGHGAGSFLGFSTFGYNPVMGIDPIMISKYDDLFVGHPDGGFAEPDGNSSDPMGTYFGDDYETYAYITNQPKYFSVNWLIRIDDDTSVALVDDTTFRKLNCDGINDDGSLLSAQDLSPLTLTNVPVAADAGDLPVGSVYRDGSDLKIKT